MDGLCSAIKRCNLELRLDNSTEGYGNCFPNAIVQQCRRPAIKTWLQKNKPSALFNSQQSVRTKVTTFALKSRHNKIVDLRRTYEQEIQQVENKSWTEYWDDMANEGTWVDHMFVQVTAWYMELDILILSTSSQPQQPFICLKGILNNVPASASGPSLLIGNYTNVHFQSLLPNHVSADLVKEHKAKQNIVTQEEQVDEDFIYIKKDTIITFKSQEITKLQCPFCKQLFPNIIKHITSKNCRIHQANIDRDEFKNQLDSFKEGYRMEMSRKRKQKSRDKLRAEKGAELIKAQHNEHARKSRVKISVEKGPEIIKSEQNKQKLKSMEKLRAEKGPELMKAQYNEHVRKSRERLRAEKGPEIIKEEIKEQKLKSRDKLRAEKGPELMNAQYNEHVRKSRDKLRVEKGPKIIKIEQNKQKLKSRKRKIEDDPESLQNNEKERKRLSTVKLRKLNPDKVKEDQRHRQNKCRLVDSEKKRLKKFRQQTMYNAIFTCTCCQRNLFDCNVSQYDNKLRIDIEDKKPGLVMRAIEEIQINVNGKIASYICFACKKHLKSGKLPPMSAKNGLKMDKIDPKLQLTELEGSLIARSIVFMKIFQLPKSRWTALKDRIINVPVHEDDIVNTMTRLPRTPNEAGLIEVDLKRKVEYKNSHLKQLIDPKKCFKMLELLKRSGNRHYQFYDDYNIYTERCKKEDFKGYTIVFDEDVELIQDLCKKPKKKKENKVSDSEEETCIEEMLENDYLKNDPVRKFQFEDYNKSLCMSNMYPEMGPENSVIVAPGEGKIPKNVLYDDDWDIKAFPHLNSPDGKYGLHFDRTTRLSSQYYFIQRICNNNPKFARSPAYVYAAVAHTELKQIQRNINVSYSRGKETNNQDGVRTLKLEDPYAVLDDIKQTPRYWKKAKYEMFAKLDNFGPFQFFFTLSCADLRWNENFAAILRSQERTLRYVIEEDQDGYPKTSIYVDHEQNGILQSDPIKKYIEEQVDDSLHECIRGNVLLATRYFNHRVKAFLNNIAMGGGNPMNVDKFSYKTEFQDRGAGHVHGVLWIKLYEIEKLCRLPDTSLVSLSKEQKSKNSGKYTEPFKGVKNAFRKFRNEQDLTEQEENAIINFIDQFTTVSLNEDEVGKEIVKIAEEVNKHHHTKTCKPLPKCRFRYPKFPIWKTVLVKPYKSEFGEEREHYLKKYAEILSKVQELLEDTDTINSIMKQYNKKSETKEEYRINRKQRILQLLEKAEVAPSDYIEALSWSRAGYSVHLKRDLDEIYINSYNPEWLRAWDGNIDIQPCFDFFGIITYVTEYFMKDDTGTMELLKQVLENNPDDSTKEKMKKIASTFLSHRQIGEAEAFFKLLPDLKLKNSNVSCQWLPLGRKEDRYKRMKKADENQTENTHLIKLEGVEGLWYEQPDILSKYTRRDDQLEKICFSHYGKMIRSGGKREQIESTDNGGLDEENYEDNLDSDEDQQDDDEEEDPNTKFHYIITEHDGPAELIPNYTKLKDPLPKENPLQYKRSFPAALRFHKVNQDNKPHKYFLSELMLYIHFRDEEQEFRPNDPDLIERIYKENYDKIQRIKSKVMEHLHDVEEARHYVEETNKILDLTKIAVGLDAAAEQSNAECQEEIEELHPDYVHLDTDNVDEQAENAGQHQNIYRTIDLPDIKTLKEKTRQLDSFQRNVIDIGVKYAKDIIKAQREFNPNPAPPLVIVHGGAGAGKSHAINSLSEWFQYILQRPGDDINCPYVIKTAFTGAAASLIEGMTLHSAFGFDFGNKHYSLSDKTRDARKNILKNLKMIVIDEISMVKADMLYQLDLRLQEIKEKIGSPFGGVSIFCFGDILQLQPVCGKFIFDRPSNTAFYLTFELDSRWHKFSVLNLEINHRQGKDRDYAEMLNRVREGKQTESDINTLKDRIRPYGHSDLDEVSLYIVCKKKECARINTEYLNRLPGDEIIVQATHFQQAQKKYKPSICKKEGTVGNSSFMDSLRLKLGCKVILIHNIDTSDGLTNGQLGRLIGSITTEDGKTSKFIVQFKNERVGRKSRSNNQAFTAKYPNGTVIEKVSFSYSLSKKASTASAKATLIQFPLKVAHAITAHKIQGQTIPKPLKVALDISSIFDDAQAHVMLSRVEEFEQIYILESLPEDKIRASAKALAELEEMNRRSINNNPTPWREDNENYIKIAALNCMNLENNYEDIVSDNTLKESSIIAFFETWLDQKSILNINGYKAHFNSIGPGKGIAIYMKNDTFKPTNDIKQDKMQITKLESPELEVITVYRSEQGSITELVQHLNNLINQDIATVVCGDFNICYQTSRNNKITQFLETNRFLQLMREATHIRGRHIDHFYFKPGNGIHENASIYRYTPYYSDHDATCVTLTRIPG